VLGQATFFRKRGIKRTARRFLGIGNLHDRINWRLVWPILCAEPQADLRFLDAGCGDGLWSLEIAKRRPRWTCVGIDNNPGRIALATHDKETCALDNVDFQVADFLDYAPRRGFDVVVSIFALHYAVLAGKGEDLFARLAEWLNPGGTAILALPRRKAETPAMRQLPALSGSSVFSRDQVLALVHHAGLEVVLLQPYVGLLGTVAKQLTASGSLRYALYPLLLLLCLIDEHRRESAQGRSFAWLVIARKPK
jgi:SAM-dependent methyltransferase